MKRERWRQSWRVAFSKQEDRPIRCRASMTRAGRRQNQRGTVPLPAVHSEFFPRQILSFLRLLPYHYYLPLPWRRSRRVVAISQRKPTYPRYRLLTTPRKKREVSVAFTMYPAHYKGHCFSKVTATAHDNAPEIRYGQLGEEQDHKFCTDANRKDLLSQKLERLRALKDDIVKDEWMFESNK